MPPPAAKTSEPVGELGFGAVGRAALGGSAAGGRQLRAVVSSSPWSLVIEQVVLFGCRARSSVAVTYW